MLLDLDSLKLLNMIQSMCNLKSSYYFNLPIEKEKASRKIIVLH
jgi:hypothetical protein